MATWNDVIQIVTGLPAVEQPGPAGGGRGWRVRGKLFAWERPLRQKDLTELGDAAPSDPPLAAYVPDLGEKEALLASQPDIYFTTSHFDGYRIVLARLDRLPTTELKELITEAWLCRAPKRLAKEYLAAASE